ncbi:DMT family transporter [Fictibacillus nanhaiensis]|uniref:DMT family transporter n=1 Tax=Fictibacillus nanhaiensis TaxID=742169 RepID=A0ABS2ZSH2_9BACL|nr:DMT family transporter [Fictibacillus nanhaiensis]
MKIWTYLLALLAGVSLSVEGAIYGELGKTIGKLESSFYNFFVGAIILGIVVLFLGKGFLPYTFQAPKWELSGGVLGTIYLTILIIAIPIVGVGIAMISVIIGQMAMSILIEHKGWLGSSKARVNKEKLIAVTLMTISLLLIF